MDLPETNSRDSKPVADAALDEEEAALTSIDPCLVDAVRNPRYRRTVLHMEEKIQKFMLNPDLHEIELPHFNNDSYLRDITSILARHYGLEPLSAESTRVFSREMANHRMPSLTLSGIPPAEPEGIPLAKPEEELTAGSKFIGIFTILKRQSGNALSRNLPEPKTRVRSLKERNEEYYKARARIFNESVSSSSISPVISRSMSPVQSGIIRDGGQAGAHGRHRMRFPVHNPGTNLNSNWTGSRSGRRMTPQQPHIIEQPPTLYEYDASNFLHQPMQYPSMQYGQPALPPYEESVSPYMLEPYRNYPMYMYYPYSAGNPPYNSAYVSYMPWSMLLSTQSLNQEPYNQAYSSYMQLPLPPSMQSLNQGLYNPPYSSYMQLPSTQSLIQEPLHFQPSVTDFDELLQYDGASIERPSRPSLDAYKASTLQSTFAPPTDPYNPANSTYMQRSMPESTQPLIPNLMPQPRSVAAEQPSTSVALQNQDVVNVPSSNENDETGRPERPSTNTGQVCERRESTSRGSVRNRHRSL